MSLDLTSKIFYLFLCSKFISLVFFVIEPLINSPHKGLCAVKGAEEYDGKHVDLTQQCGKPPPAATHAVLIVISHLEAPMPPYRGDVNITQRSCNRF